LINKYVSSVSI